jgi:hypothetical protein
MRRRGIWSSPEVAPATSASPVPIAADEEIVPIGADVTGARRGGVAIPYLVGTDSHTTMVNGLGVLGGASAARAEAAMLGQPVSC